MAMTKADFISLADHIRKINNNPDIAGRPFGDSAIVYLADYLEENNPAFMRDRWLGYVRGENGKNGGKV